MRFMRRGRNQDIRHSGIVGDRMMPLNLAIKIALQSEILQKLAEREGHVDERLESAIEYACPIFSGTIQDEASFLSLIWHDIPDSRALTPPGESRTLRDVAGRMIRNNHSFDTLCSLNNWFKPCVCIHECFDHDKLNWVVVTNERNEIYERTPCGSLYIYDGCHKSLVYAYRLLTGASQYKPVEVLWLLTKNGVSDLPD